MMKKLEMNSVNLQPDPNDVYLVYAMFFLRTIPNSPATYDSIAEAILRQACSLASVVQEIDVQGKTKISYTITELSQQ